MISRIRRGRKSCSSTQHILRFLYRTLTSICQVILHFLEDLHYLDSSYLGWERLTDWYRDGQIWSYIYVQNQLWNEQCNKLKSQMLIGRPFTHIFLLLLLQDYGPSSWPSWTLCINFKEKMELYKKQIILPRPPLEVRPLIHLLRCLLQVCPSSALWFHSFLPSLRHQPVSRLWGIWPDVDWSLRPEIDSRDVGVTIFVLETYLN